MLLSATTTVELPVLLLENFKEWIETEMLLRYRGVLTDRYHKALGGHLKSTDGVCLYYRES